MSDARPGLPRRLLCGFWNALNLTRRLVVNLIFLAIVLVVVASLFRGGLTIEARSALVLDPRGDIVEQYTTDPGERALNGLAGNASREVQLRDLLRAIERATTDRRIERIVLVPDEIGAAGLSTLREVGQALDRFRAAGKDVVVVSAGMSQGQYFLAAHANRILLDPSGSVLLEGFSSYRSYFREALDKLGIDVRLIKVGEYKSAAEPYVRNAASDDAKAADRYWMGGIWQDYLDEIAALRQLDAKRLADDIAHYDERIEAHDGDLAALALEQKLVDALATRAQARDELRKLGVADRSGNTFRQVAYKDYLDVIARETLPDLRAGVAVIVAQGEIVPGERPQGTIGGQSTAQLVRAAREDDQVKAIVLRVDSPGGEAHASELIRRELAQAREAGKPVVVSMGDVAASGGYWIATASDEIWAQPTTITGSIGIYGLLVSAPEALAKLGVHTDGIGTTPLAGAFDVRRPVNPQIEAIVTSQLRKGYRDFITLVAEAREQTPEQIDAIARGRVWSGAQAKERGLVDRLGGLTDAIGAAAARAGLGEDYRVDYVEQPLSAWERFALSFGGSEAALHLARWSGFTLPRTWLPESELRQAIALVDGLGGKRYGVVAHCFCELRD